MRTVLINGAELQFIELIRIALSERDDAQRLRAINNVRHEVVAELLALEVQGGGLDRSFGLESTDFLRWVARTAAERHEATREFARTVRRYEGANGYGNERKLNIAEHIGKLVLLTIKEGKFRGLYSRSGILEGLRHEAKKLEIKGAVDKDTLPKTWKTYRGVVHLGMAMDFCADNPEAGWDVLSQAELIRKELSGHCPKSTSRPYVDPESQICFISNPTV